MVEVFNQSRARSDTSQSPEEVEKQLRHLSRKLAETEVNIGLFYKMAKSGVPTSDVRHFVLNQAEMKQHDSHVRHDIVRKVMRGKLNDACSAANRLRQRKKKLKRLLCTEHNYSTSKRREVMKKIAFNTANHKGNFKTKIDRKFLHCKQKMDSFLSDKSRREIPADTWEIDRSTYSNRT